MALSKTWTNTWLTGSSDTGDLIDDKMNDMSAAIDERLENLGAYWPQSNVDECGVLFISPNAYDSDEFNIYGVSGSAPDTANKRFSLTSTTVTVGTTTTNCDMTLNGDLTLTGNITGAAGTTITIGDTSDSSNFAQILIDCADVDTQLYPPFRIRHVDSGGSTHYGLEFVTINGSQPRLEVGNSDPDTGGNSAGPGIKIGYNSNSTAPTPGWLAMADKSGNNWYLFFDTTGDLKVRSTRPFNDENGTVVGTQS